MFFFKKNIKKTKKNKMNKYEINFENSNKKFSINEKFKKIIEKKEIEEEYIKYYFLSNFNNKKNKKYEIRNLLKEINNKLIGNFLNIFLRSSKPIINEYGCFLAENITDKNIFIEYLNLEKIFKKLYKEKKYSEINNITMKFAKKINFYMEIEKPWNMSKNDITKKRAHLVYTTSINLFLILLIGIKPLIPKISKKIEEIINIENISWENFKQPILKKKIKKYCKIINKIDEKYLL